MDGINGPHCGRDSAFIVYNFESWYASGWQMSESSAVWRATGDVIKRIMAIVLRLYSGTNSVRVSNEIE